MASSGLFRVVVFGVGIGLGFCIGVAVVVAFIRGCIGRPFGRIQVLDDDGDATIGGVFRFGGEEG